MGMGMNGFRLGRSPEQFGDLGVSVFFSLGGKGQVLTVGLAFTCKCSGKIVIGFHKFGSSLNGLSWFF